MLVLNKTIDVDQHWSCHHFLTLEYLQRQYFISTRILLDIYSYQLWFNTLYEKIYQYEKSLIINEELTLPSPRSNSATIELSWAISIAFQSSRSVLLPLGSKLLLHDTVIKTFLLLLERFHEVTIEIFLQVTQAVKTRLFFPHGQNWVLSIII